ncbi:MAG: pilus assembly protein [Chloroflexi bacterium]|nr:pilus assembly protein [Chloroflexota bacterium]
MLPILLLVILGIIDFGRALLSYSSASNALRNAEVAGVDDLLTNYSDCKEMRRRIGEALYIGRSDISIQYQKHDSSTIIPCAGDSIDPALLTTGDLLQINITSKVNLITPLINGLFPALTFNFAGQRTILVNIPLTVADADTDYDGMLDTWEMDWFTNLDATGTDDPDNDLCNNGCEETRGTNPLNPDTDGDGLLDGEEIYIHDTHPINPDTDGDGLDDGDELSIYGTDPLDPDTDDDGLSDGQEVLLGALPGVTDSDGDGITDGNEVNVYGTNPILVDTDDDGLTDPEEVFNYGTLATNPDTDSDGLRDGPELKTYGTSPHEPDTDGDSLIDGMEVSVFSTSPLLVDTDADNLPDPDEINVHHTTPYKFDSDDDGLSDWDEIFLYGTQAMNPDSDGDGLSDGVEIETYGTDPNDTDSDDDGISDADEVAAGTTPAQLDSDGDGLGDTWEITLFRQPGAARAGRPRLRPVRQRVRRDVEDVPDGHRQ